MNDYQHLAVCMTCFDLTGIYEGREHRCFCQPTDDEWREREFENHDIAATIDLCHLCVRNPMRSGTRWSWYACEQCRDVDNRIASALAGIPDPRNRILPLGRHSIMNGAMLRVGDGQHDIATKRFTEALTEMSRLWSRFHEWKQEEAERLAEVSELDGLSSVPLDTWLASNRSSLGSSVDAWCRFVGENLPDIPELDDLRHARYEYMDRRTA